MRNRIQFETVFQEFLGKNGELKCPQTSRYDVPDMTKGPTSRTVLQNLSRKGQDRGLPICVPDSYLSQGCCRTVVSDRSEHLEMKQKHQALNGGRAFSGHGVH